MNKNRLEAFSDGVLAIIITIMILEIKVPNSNSFESLKPLIPVFLSYVLSFAYVGIYWNNHHHIFQAVKQVNGKVLWGNLFLLFWLSLIPFATSWIGSQHFSAVPMSCYGFILFMCGLSYTILVKKIIKLEGKNSLLAKVTQKDYKGRISLVFYLLGISLAFVSVWISGLLYFAVALFWIVPNMRIEKEIIKYN
ncbi:TMEM175 family protein [Flavobacterium sp.]|uniref:TMEM175 family protein n=1 Tax=Flavobacterium sp. TaxID=239 RepID=UPI003798B493